MTVYDNTGPYPHNLPGNPPDARDLLREKRRNTPIEKHVEALKEAMGGGARRGPVEASGQLAVVTVDSLSAVLDEVEWVPRYKENIYTLDGQVRALAQECDTLRVALQRHQERTRDRVHKLCSRGDSGSEECIQLCQLADETDKALGEGRHSEREASS